ncbi:hypothetical protein GE061_002674 [Apolygus lucorum]|uniref:TP53 regulated inhibitor of apoptosis 1 n=1 Tax=Apolygus lucorum TaxID=248454 RepID=A0A6A4JI10_APOLU|nr:hypothetical protein GE061_002674 [Apolygus lucorum]
MVRQRVEPLQHPMISSIVRYCIGCLNQMEACGQLKEDYDACFNVWFSQKFLKGDNNDSMCAQLLKVYKQCVEGPVEPPDKARGTVTLPELNSGGR